MTNPLPEPLPPAPLPGPPPEPTMTQSQVSALVARETDRATRAFQSQLLTNLGLSSVDDIATMVTAAKAAEQAQMSEQQRATAAAEAATAAATADRAALAADRLALKTEQALIRSGVPLEVEQPDGQKVPNPQLAGLARLVNVAVGADDAAIAAAVAEVKTTYPQLFATQAAPPPPGSVPPVVRPPRNPGNTDAAPGATGRQALTEYGFVKPRPPA